MKDNKYNRRDFIKTLMTGMMGAGCLSSTIHAKQKGQTRPNILFLFLDDLGYGDISSYNPKSKIDTPNIDRLAKEGVSFMDAHAAASICGPSRYALMTGRYPWRRAGRGTGNGAKFRDVYIEKGRTTLATLLKEKNYNTAQIGKWGLRHNYSEAVKDGKKPGYRDSYDFPNKRLLGSKLFGFDYSWCMMHLFPLKGKKKIGDYAKNQFENGLPIDPELKLTDPSRWLPESGTKVVDYIKAYGGKKNYPKFNIDRNKPFFIYWDPPSPHTPIVPSKEFIGKSKAGAYGDFVIEIDHYVGQMLDALDKLKLSNNTLVIFSSDNGPASRCYKDIQSYKHYSMGSFRGVKCDNWEGGHRVPLIIRWPGVVKPGRKCDELVSMTDWMATFAEIMGRKLTNKEGEDSVSILPLIKADKETRPVRDSMIHHTPQGKYAIRNKDRVLIDYKKGNAKKEPAWFRKERKVIKNNFPGELFDLKSDPQQTINVYDKYPEKVKELKMLLEQGKKALRKIEF